ncbi:hypothetical protein [Tenacibaculum xiamenense]|uniref:hypothetical protein n=1 Tax=Tenacibaculum xiamenense TaxID=1261553 RepID=UPI0038965297
MKRTIVSYEKLSNEVLTLLKEMYPYGFDDKSIITFSNAKGETQQAVQVHLEGNIYLIKINKRVNDDFIPNDDISGFDFYDNHDDNQINY